METINKLAEAVGNVIELTNNAISEIHNEISEKAPVMIHQRLVNEFARTAKNTVKHLMKFQSVQIY